MSALPSVGEKVHWADGRPGEMVVCDSGVDPAKGPWVHVQHQEKGVPGHLLRREVVPAGKVKREFSQEQRDRAADSGAAMPDGSFPIKTPQDLENAIHAHGRAKDPAAARRHIIKRARALGLTSKLPEDWA